MAPKEEPKGDVKEEKATEEVKSDAKEEAKEEPKEEAKVETKEEAKEETKEEAKDEAKDEVMEEEGKDEVMEEEPEVKELEEDAAADKRKKVPADAVAWSAVDSTLNVMRVNGGNLLMSITEGGFQYLLAGLRSTAGVKAGRYMLELKIVESLHPVEPQGSQGRTPAPRNLVRVGVSLAGSSLFLADTADSVCFDSEGYFYHGKKRSKVSEKFGRDQVVALVINLDDKSPNANTVSLFRDGQRISEPQKLPESLCGKVLYPAITYKNVTLHVNMGPVVKAPLPFTCTMLQDAAAADVEVIAQPATKGPCEVIFPVGLPDQGAFDFVDGYLEQNPHHMELSDRKVLEWASKSGIWRPKGYAQRTSTDKPDLNFGIALMDDNSVGNVLSSLAPAVKRNYVVMELRGNLLAEERKQALQRFSGPDFKKVALVLMGEPSADYKQKVQALMLAEKAAKAETEKRRKAAEEERKRLLEEKRKKAEEARKSREAKRNANKDEAGEDKEEKEEKEKEDEEMGAEAKENDETKVEDAPIELTEEEKQLWYRKCPTVDLSEKSLATSYASFTIPTKEEGFDEVKYVWQPKDKCDTYLREWLLEQKRTQRAEDLEPSPWFKEQYEKWRKTLQDWKKRQNEMKDPVKRKYAQKKKEEEAKKKKQEAGGEEDGEAAEEEAKPEPMAIDVNEVDVDSVEDVADLGNGEPLFAEFVYEDWALVSSRFELHLLIHAFRKDLNDPDRPSFREAHMAYYFEKYFKKSFVLKNFNVEAFTDFLELIEDSISLAEGSGMLESKWPEDTAHSKFVKLAEEHRRDRARRVDAGDETAQLKFKKPQPPPPSQPRRPQGHGKDDRDKGRGKDDNRSDRDKGRGKDGGRPQYSGGGGNYHGGGGGHGSRDPPPSRYGSSSGGSHGSSRDASYGGKHGGSSSYSSEKRSYGSSSNYPPAKQSRTSSYSGGGGGGSGGGGYSKGGGGGGGNYSGYRR